MKKIFLVVLLFIYFSSWVNANSNFYYWNCTWYVSKQLKVTWTWNAKDWLNNARNKWKETWNIPQKKSIIVFWTWYNEKYWHVAIVESRKDDIIIVSEMNYKKLNEITYRKINIYDNSIVWYIYN